jgi:hypothetical protein
MHFETNSVTVSESVLALADYMHTIGYAPGTITQRVYRLTALGIPPENATRDDARGYAAVAGL